MDHWHSVDSLLARAAYYRWAAARGQSLPGGDPTFGRPRSAFNPLDRAEGAAAYKAMARVALAAARRARLLHG
jgi:hypothetical protein